MELVFELLLGTIRGLLKFIRVVLSLLALFVKLISLLSVIMDCDRLMLVLNSFKLILLVLLIKSFVVSTNGSNCLKRDTRVRGGSQTSPLITIDFFSNTSNSSTNLFAGILKSSSLNRELVFVLVFVISLLSLLFRLFVWFLLKQLSWPKRQINILLNHLIVIEFMSDSPKLFITIF